MHTGDPSAPLVSVLIPVYNCSAFLRRCLDSVFGQTMQSFEVIAVNDGSTDDSLAILNEYAAEHPNLRVLDQPNAGQGAARNRAIDLAIGEYILFVDADDFIERVTLQVTTERADQDRSDLVHFDWKLLVPSPARPAGYNYYNADPFWHKRVLDGVECDELLRVENLFSVSNLYRRSFLEEFGIRFEEGRIYEDNPFVVHAVNRARRVSMVHSPLYIVNPHPDSTTRSHTDTDRHFRDHLYAVRRSFELLDRRNPRAAAYLAAYHIKKLGPYYERRIPKRYRREYIREFVDILHDADVDIPEGTSANRPTRLAVRLQIFERQRYALFQSIIAGKNSLMPRVKRTRATLRRVKHRRDDRSPWSSQLEAALRQPVIPGSISFLGLDYAYSGNSRYLFEEMIADPRFEGCAIRFVTRDRRVAPRYRLEPGAVETNSHLARSEVVVAESWIPETVRKHPDSTWFQLWHGTPLKRVLFDSHEPRIIWNRRKHKINKYRDIQHWDYLVVDSEAAAEKFETAFLFPPERMIRSGYPRVNYLLEHDGDAELRGRILEGLGIDPERDHRKIVLYAPTWRDYNYGKSPEDTDYGYLLDVRRFSEELGDGYLVLFHEHGYLSSRADAAGGGWIDTGDTDIQDLLLVSDIVVSDYSSVIFDALAIDRRIVLYAPDIEGFRETRGLYEDVWERFARAVVVTEDELIEACRGDGEGLVSEQDMVTSYCVRRCRELNSGGLSNAIRNRAFQSDASESEHRLAGKIEE